MADQHYIKARVLLKRYLEGNCTEAEKAWVEDWYLSIDNPLNKLADKQVQEDLYELQIRLQEIPQQKSALKTYIRAVAAILLVVLTIGLILWNERQDTEVTVVEMTATGQDVMPGTNRATLSFDNEEEIELNTHQQGLINKGNTIVYADGTTLKTVENVQMATLRTPVAGQYQVTLPDGTKVWLNALSSIRYPTAFTGDKRQIEITGEVYLEVAHDADKPFIVQTSEQRIQVLGTSFNINAYRDNGETLTTLAEGMVRVSHDKFGSEVKLQPGQQAIVADNKAIEVKRVDVGEVSSWKDGLYIVSDEPLEQYARKIERWYDVQVDMKPHGAKRLSAIIPRDAKLSEVLQAIELKTGVKFAIKERRISVKR